MATPIHGETDDFPGFCSAFRWTRRSKTDTIERMFERLDTLLGDLRETAYELEQQPLNGARAATLLERAADIERIAASIRTYAARRVSESKIWQRDGHHSAAHMIAATTGTTVTSAVRVLQTARRLEELPETREEFRAGRLSEEQVQQVAGAAYADPRQERALLTAARQHTVKGLVLECSRVKNAVVPDELANQRRLHKQRSLRHWMSDDGSVQLHARLTPDAGATVVSAVEALQRKIFEQARREGRRESAEAYAADALVELASNVTAGRATMASAGPRARVSVLVDYDVLRSGNVAPGQTCEIKGVGPISAATARMLAEDSILRILVTQGCDVLNTTRATRTVSTRLRAALEVRDPTCRVPGCDATHNLEIDHLTPWGCGGPTRLGNLARVCRRHHEDKTYHGWRLSGGPGHWTWESPEDQEGAPDEPDR
jgi:hypothetical protein